MDNGKNGLLHLWSQIKGYPFLLLEAFKDFESPHASLQVESGCKLKSRWVRFNLVHAGETWNGGIERIFLQCGLKWVEKRVRVSSFALEGCDLLLLSPIHC